MSLNDLATLINFSKGHLSKVERGEKRPGADLVQICDAVLEAGGRLQELGAPRPSRGPETPVHETSVRIPWSLHMRTDGGSDFVAFDPAADPALPPVVLSWSIAPAFEETLDVGPALPHFRTMFDEYRRLGQSFGPAVVAQLCVVATSALRGMAQGARPGHREIALRLASRFAEYTGWMAQEAGDDAATLWWTDQAVHLAAAGGDDELAAYALVRQAELALYGGDSLATVELARRAGRQARSVRIRGLAAQREAQGHALVGDRDSCRGALDRGAALTSDAEPASTDDPVLGSVHLPDLSAFVAGWCMQELGSPAEAVTLLADGLDAIDPQARRARARYGARLALALAHVGEIERACEIAESVASSVALVDSATIRTDLLRLSRVLNRWPKNSAVRHTVPLLAAGLHAGRHRPGNPA